MGQYYTGRYAPPEPICPYCRSLAVFWPSSERFYNGRNYGAVWACEPCEAWVGCHKTGTGRAPLGRLANRSLREMKIKAHAVFDPLWRLKMRRDSLSKHDARGAAYKWLADTMGMDRKDCHIAMMDEAQCNRVIAICKPYATKLPAEAADAA